MEVGGGWECQFSFGVGRNERTVGTLRRQLQALAE